MFSFTRADLIFQTTERRLRKEVETSIQLINPNFGTAPAQKVLQHQHRTSLRAMSAMPNASIGSVPAVSLPGASNGLRSYAAGLDFVYLTPLLCVCRTPATEAEAERLSAHFHSQHPHNHRIMNCTAYSATHASVHSPAGGAPTTPAHAQTETATAAAGKHKSAALQIVSAGPDGEELSIAQPKLTSTRYFDSSEDYRGPVSLKQLMHCVFRADSYLASNPHGVLVFMCETGAGKSCVYAACFLLYIGAVLSAEEACAMVAKERCHSHSGSGSSSAARGTNSGPAAAIFLQHTRALCIPSHRRYVVYFESLLRSAGDRWHCNTYQLSRIRVLGGIPNLHQSLLEKGCRLHVAVKGAKFLPRSEDFDSYAPPRTQSSRSNNNNNNNKTVQERERERELADATGAEVLVMYPLFNQLKAAYNNDYSAVPFYRVSEGPGEVHAASASGSASALPIGHSKTTVDLDLSTYEIQLRGDCIIEIHSDELLVMSISLHSAFVTNNGYLQFDKMSVDLICEDVRHKIYSAETKVEVFLTPVDDAPMINVLPLPRGGQETAPAN